MSSRSGIRERFRSRKDRYLAECGSSGGTAADFIDQCLRDRRAAPEDYDPYIDEAVAEVARSVWERDTEPGQGKADLFTWGGTPLPVHITFPDPSKPSEYRKIDAQFAKISHLREHGIIRMEIGAITIEKGRRIVEMCREMTELAGGDAPLIDVVGKA